MSEVLSGSEGNHVDILHSAPVIPPVPTLADIEAYIAAEVAKAVTAANEPAPVRVATPAEKLRIVSDQLHASGGRDGQQIAYAIEAIVDYILSGGA